MFPGGPSDGSGEPSPPPLWQDESLGPSDLELKELKESLQDTQPVGVLVDCCKTLDQVTCVRNTPIPV